MHEDLTTTFEYFFKCCTSDSGRSSTRVSSCLSSNPRSPTLLLKHGLNRIGLHHFSHLFHVLTDSPELLKSVGVLWTLWNPTMPVRLPGLWALAGQLPGRFTCGVLWRSVISNPKEQHCLFKSYHSTLVARKQFTTWEAYINRFHPSCANSLARAIDLALVGCCKWKSLSHWGKPQLSYNLTSGGLNTWRSRNPNEHLGKGLILP